MFKFQFKKPFYKNFSKLFFTQNNDNIYYDNSHKNYIYKETINENDSDVNYIFYGFFKDDFFVIIFDSFNCKLNINVEHKFIILIKLKWILNKVTDSNIDRNRNSCNTDDTYSKSLWELDTSKIYKNKEAFILNIRKKILNEKYINIDDYIKIYEYNNILINISYLNNRNDNVSNQNLYNQKLYNQSFSIFQYLKCLTSVNEES